MNETMMRCGSHGIYPQRTKQAFSIRRNFDEFEPIWFYKVQNRDLPECVLPPKESLVTAINSL